MAGKVQKRSQDDRIVNFDADMVPVADALWAVGLKAITAVRDIGADCAKVSRREAEVWAGYVLLEFTPAEACALLDLVQDAAEFRGRLHWASTGAWEISEPILAGIGPQGNAASGGWAQVRFPNDQVDDLLAVLKRAGSRRS